MYQTRKCPTMHTEATYQTKVERRVLLAEDNKDWQKTIAGILKDVGATLVLTVETLEEALAATVLMKKLQIDLVILGGNLGEYKDENPDSAAILAALAAQESSVKTIGLSADKTPGVDRDVQKWRANTLLESTIIELLSDSKES